MFVNYVLKIFQTNFMKNKETAYLKWKELNQYCSWKMVCHFNKRKSLFDKRTLEYSERGGGGQIPSKSKVDFDTFNSNYKKNIFLWKGYFLAKTPILRRFFWNRPWIIRVIFFSLKCVRVFDDFPFINNPFV